MKSHRHLAIHVLAFAAVFQCCSIPPLVAETRIAPAAADLKKRIADADASKNVKQLEIVRKDVAGSSDQSIRQALGEAYFNAGIRMMDANQLEGAIEQFKVAAEFGSPTPHRIYNDWAVAVNSLALNKPGTQSESQFAQAAALFQKAIALKPEKHEGWLGWANVLGSQARAKKGAEADRLWAQAAEKYQKVIALKPGEHNAWYNWGFELAAQGRTKEGVEADRLFAQASEKYQRAVAIKPDYHEAWHNWGSALAAHAQKITDKKLPAESSLMLTLQASKKRTDQLENLWKQACEKFQKAISIKPDKHKSWFLWADTLDSWARWGDIEAAEKLWPQADQCFRRAVALKPDYQSAWHGWGLMLASQADRRGGPTEEGLWKQAIEKYQRAVAIAPEPVEAWFQWGYALSSMAHPKKGAEKEQLLGQAIEKYRKTVALKPDKREAWNNWGLALVKMALPKNEADADKLFLEAEQKYLRAIQVAPDFEDSLLNYACVSARRGRTTETVERLRKWLPHHTFSAVGALETKPDFNRIRKTPEFVAFMAELRKLEKK